MTLQDFLFYIECLQPHVYKAGMRDYPDHSDFGLNHLQHYTFHINTFMMDELTVNKLMYCYMELLPVDRQSVTITFETSM